MQRQIALEVNETSDEETWNARVASKETATACAVTVTGNATDRACGVGTGTGSASASGSRSGAKRMTVCVTALQSATPKFADS